MNLSDYIIRDVYLENAYVFLCIYMHADLLYTTEFVIQFEINNTHCSQ